MKNVAVVIPTRNRGEATIRAIRSALSQTLKPVEIIVVDDGSDDDSPAVIEKAVGQYITFIRLAHCMGANFARNTGIQAASAEFIAMLDSDDEYLPDKLRWQVARMEADGFGFGFCGYLTDKGRTFRPRPNIGNRLSFYNCFGGTSGLLARRELLLQVPFDPAMKAVQDWELYLRMVGIGSPSLVSEPLYRYNTASEQRITGHSLNRFIGHRQLYRRHIKDLGQSAPDVVRYHKLIQLELLRKGRPVLQSLCARALLHIGRLRA